MEAHGESFEQKVRVAAETAKWGLDKVFIQISGTDFSEAQRLVTEKGLSVRGGKRSLRQDLLCRSVANYLLSQYGFSFLTAEPVHNNVTGMVRIVIKKKKEGDY